jgi:hypothetical protein
MVFITAEDMLPDPPTQLYVFRICGITTIPNSNLIRSKELRHSRGAVRKTPWLPFMKLWNGFRKTMQNQTADLCEARTVSWSSMIEVLGRVICDRHKQGWGMTVSLNT